MARTRSENCEKTNDVEIVKMSDSSYAKAVKTVPAIIVKKTESSGNISSAEIDQKMKNALQGFKVSKTHVKNNGTMVVETPNQKKIFWSYF